MKRIYIVGSLLLAVFVGVVIGQSQGFVFAKDEGYLEREGYIYERCIAPGEERRHFQHGNQDSPHRRGHRHHKNRQHKERCIK